MTVTIHQDIMHKDVIPKEVVSEKQVEKQRFTFKSWYEKNKEKLAAERKKKYDSDPSYRDKVKVQAKQYRAKRPKKERKKSEKVTIPMLCEKAGCSPHTFRKYVQLGWLPKGSIHINFNDSHVQLLANLCNAAKDTKYLRNGRIETLQPYIDAIATNWK
jgi:hypothetical protein